MRMRITSGGVAKAVLFLYACTAYLPANMFAFNLGFMQLSPMRILQVVAAAMCLCKVAILSYKRQLKIPLHPNACYLCFFAFWMIYAALSFLWSADRYNWLRTFYFYFGGVTTIFAFSLYLNSLDDIKKLLWISIIMTFIHAIIGYNEVTSGNYFFLQSQNVERAESYARKALPVSSMYNVNGFAGVMLIGFFSVLAIYPTLRKKLIKLLFAFVLLFQLALFVIARSRGAMFGLVFSLLMLFLLYSHIRKRLISIAVVAILLSGVVIMLLPMILPSNIQSLEDMLLKFLT